MTSTATQWVLAIGLLLLQLILSSLGTIFWMSHRNLQRQLAERKEREEKLETELKELNIRLPREYVSKDDYVRSIVGFENKLDEMLTAIHAVANNLQIHVQGTTSTAESSYNRLTPAQQTQRGG
jgi:SMC interacting uncharacterized protein involved in chromosome segregation